jgi:hypothetical protein
VEWNGTVPHLEAVLVFSSKKEWNGMVPRKGISALDAERTHSTEIGGTSPFLSTNPSLPCLALLTASSGGDARGPAAATHAGEQAGRRRELARRRRDLARRRRKQACRHRGRRRKQACRHRGRRQGASMPPPWSAAGAGMPAPSSAAGSKSQC